MRTPATTEMKPLGDGGAWLATLVLLYIFITLTPFRDLYASSPTLNAELQSNTLNQIVSIAIFAAMMALGLRKDLRPILLRPLPIIGLLVAWVMVSTMIGPAGATGARRVVMAAMLIGMASVFLLLPRDERQLAGILAVAASVVLALCYLGVIFLPRLSIHQADDYLEPALAGNWRGIFDHKNAAAPSMVLLSFMGLYVAKTRNRILGWTIFAAAAFFVYQSGGKTAMVLLPATLVLVWLIERGNLFWRAMIVLGVVAGYSAMTVGSTILPGIGSFLTALGVDATFTGRTDIWTVAIEGVKARPLFGYGHGGFWGTEGLVFGFREQESWAVTAPTAHNSWLDMLLMGGVVGLVLTLIWIVLLPLRDMSRAIARKGATPLIRLYTRIWMFCLILAGMESVILSTNGQGWFLMMVAVFGLRLEARAYRRETADAPVAAGAVPAL